MPQKNDKKRLERPVHFRDGSDTDRTNAARGQGGEGDDIGLQDTRDDLNESQADAQGKQCEYPSRRQSASTQPQQNNGGQLTPGISLAAEVDKQGEEYSLEIDDIRKIYNLREKLLVYLVSVGQPYHQGLALIAQLKLLLIVLYFFHEIVEKEEKWKARGHADVIENLKGKWRLAAVIADTLQCYNQFIHYREDVEEGRGAGREEAIAEQEYIAQGNEWQEIAKRTLDEVQVSFTAALQKRLEKKGKRADRRGHDLFMPGWEFYKWDILSNCAGEKGKRIEELLKQMHGYPGRYFRGGENITDDITKRKDKYIERCERRPLVGQEIREDCVLRYLFHEIAILQFLLRFILRQCAEKEREGCEFGDAVQDLLIFYPTRFKEFFEIERKVRKMITEWKGAQAELAERGILALLDQEDLKNLTKLMETRNEIKRYQCSRALKAAPLTKGQRRHVVEAKAKSLGVDKITRSLEEPKVFWGAFVGKLQAQPLVSSSEIRHSGVDSCVIDETGYHERVRAHWDALIRNSKGHESRISASGDLDFSEIEERYYVYKAAVKFACFGYDPNLMKYYYEHKGKVMTIPFDRNGSGVFLSNDKPVPRYAGYEKLVARAGKHPLVLLGEHVEDCNAVCNLLLSNNNVSKLLRFQVCGKGVNDDEDLNKALNQICQILKFKLDESASTEVLVSNIRQYYGHSRDWAPKIVIALQNFKDPGVPLKALEELFGIDNIEIIIAAGDIKRENIAVGRRVEIIEVDERKIKSNIITELVSALSHDILTLPMNERVQVGKQAEEFTRGLSERSRLYVDLVSAYLMQPDHMASVLTKYMQILMIKKEEASKLGFSADGQEIYSAFQASLFTIRSEHKMSEGFNEGYWQAILAACIETGMQNIPKKYIALWIENRVMDSADEDVEKYLAILQQYRLIQYDDAYVRIHPDLRRVIMHKPHTPSLAERLTWQSKTSRWSTLWRLRVEDHQELDRGVMLKIIQEQLDQPREDTLSNALEVFGLLINYVSYAPSAEESKNIKFLGLERGIDFYEAALRLLDKIAQQAGLIQNQLMQNAEIQRRDPTPPDQILMRQYNRQLVDYIKLESIRSLIIKGEELTEDMIHEMPQPNGDDDLSQYRKILKRAYQLVNAQDDDEIKPRLDKLKEIEGYGFNDIRDDCEQSDIKKEVLRRLRDYRWRALGKVLEQFCDAVMAITFHLEGHCSEAVFTDNARVLQQAGFFANASNSAAQAEEVDTVPGISH